MSVDFVVRFENKVWETRKARINAAERLQRMDIYTKFMVNYYSLVVVIYSVLEIYPHTKTDLSLPLVIASIALFGASLYISSMNYGGRANDLKLCYIKLDTLIGELKIIQFQSAEENDMIQQFRAIEQRYTELLGQVENHSMLDYWKVLMVEQTSKRLSSSQSAMIYAYNCGKLLVQILFILVPIFPLFVRGV